MSHYKTFRTTTGRKYRMRMDGDDVAEKWIGRILSAVLTFAGSAGMFLLWIKLG